MADVMTDETPEQRTARALEKIGHMSEILARQSKLLEKSLNVLVAVEYARLRYEDGSVYGVDPRRVLEEFDGLVLAIRETKGAGLRLQDDGWYGKES